MVSNNFQIEMKGGGFNKELKSQLSFLASAHPTMMHSHSELREEYLTNSEIVGCFFAKSTKSSQKMNLL